MTGAQTDPVRVPLYETASALMTQLGKRLFDAAQHSPEDTPAAIEAFEKWYSVRCINDYVLRTRSLDLNDQNRKDLKEACELVHDLAHDADIDGTPAIENCKCETADRIMALSSVMVAWEAERAATRKKETAA